MYYYIMENIQKKILYVRHLWWAFGSHLLNIKWDYAAQIKSLQS